MLQKKYDLLVPAGLQEFATKWGISTLEASVLLNRGINENVETFINKPLNNLHSPRLMKGAEKAADFLNEAIQAKEKICLDGDYDVDGASCAIIGKKIIDSCGGDCFVYINHRKMGYGINREAIDKILEMHPDTKLILTADNGIVAFDAIDYANSLGLKVVVTDHHQPSADGKVPNALVVVNPHLEDDDYPFEDLCGAAVLWKVLGILLQKHNKWEEAKKYLDIVALATVADVVPLVDENRVIVHHGLKMMTNNVRPQWKILKEAFSGYDKIIQVDTRTIGFSFAPAINAISRMRGDIMPAVRLFLTDDEEEMKQIVDVLYGTNEERKALTKDQTNAAMIEAELQEDLPVCIVRHEEIIDGLCGLVAGRVREAIQKPTIVLTREGNLWRGSGRSIEGYHIKNALDEIQAKTGLLAAYGGHSQACGLSVADEDIANFCMEFIEHADNNIPPEAFVKHVFIDYEAKEEEINARFVDRIKNLEPYGQNFEEPIIGIRDFVPEEIKFIGSEKQHLILKGKGFEVISWYGAHIVDDMTEPSFTFCGRVEKDDFGVKFYVEPEDFIK